MLSAASESTRCGAAVAVSLHLDLLANPFESLINFVVSSDRFLDFPMLLILPPEVNCLRRLKGSTVFSNNSSDSQRAVFSLAHKAILTLLQLL